MSPRLSVIIPVFNSERTLRKCVNSILSQDFQDFELLLINDGSVDQSKSLCDEFALLDNRVRVFHSVNGGVSSARNKGIANSKGSSIFFCDSDDQIAEGSLKALMSYQNFDVVLGSYVYKPINKIVGFEDGEYCNKDEIGGFLKTNVYKGFSTPWAKLYKTSIIKQNSLFFDVNINSGEDTLWVNEYMTHVINMRVLKFEVYFYKENSNSLSRRGIDLESFNCTIEKLEQVVCLMESRFVTDFNEFRLYMKLHFFHRLILHFSHYSAFSIRKNLQLVCSDLSIVELFNDEQYINKGLRLRAFNFLVRKNCFFILGVYVKIFKRYV